MGKQGMKYSPDYSTIFNFLGIFFFIILGQLCHTVRLHSLFIENISKVCYICFALPQFHAFCNHKGHRRRELGPSVVDRTYLGPQPSAQSILHGLSFFSPFPFVSFLRSLILYFLQCKNHAERMKGCFMSVLNGLGSHC